MLGAVVLQLIKGGQEGSGTANGGLSPEALPAV